MFSIRPAAYYKTERGTYQLILQVTLNRRSYHKQTKKQQNNPTNQCIPISSSSTTDCQTKTYFSWPGPILSSSWARTWP